MFPGSIFAKGYQQSDSKVQYVIKYGIADHLKKQLICDVKNTPYSLLFDETANSQVKSNMMGVWCIGPKGLIVLSIHNVDRHLLGIALLSIWLSILRNLWSFCEAFEGILDSKFLLYFGMDGPHINLSFENKLTQKLSEVDTSFLKLGSCSLQPFHSAFEKGIKQLFQG